jgi:hypothetical protein
MGNFPGEFGHKGSHDQLVSAPEKPVYNQLPMTIFTQEGDGVQHLSGFSSVDFH